MSIRERLIDVSLEWQETYGISPPITSTLSELDTSELVGMPNLDYSEFMQGQTAVQKGYDFIYEGVRYQVESKCQQRTINTSLIGQIAYIIAKYKSLGRLSKH